MLEVALVRALLSLLPTSLLVAAISAVPWQTASAHDPLSCKMTFSLSGWSVFYKTATGRGSVTCSNGQKMSVRLRTKGGGLSVGKSSIRGRGEFTGVRSIDDVLGSYALAQAHAGAVKSSNATVMTKGEVSLAMAGTGEGWDLGVAFGKFVIER